MKTSTHRSLERGLALLESVAASARPISLAESARRTGLSQQMSKRLGYHG
jgi:DNA-binding IclR family transcriptional regulator